jgi:hypothetical protein
VPSAPGPFGDQSDATLEDVFLRLTWRILVTKARTTTSRTLSARALGWAREFSVRTDVREQHPVFLMEQSCTPGCETDLSHAPLGRDSPESRLVDSDRSRGQLGRDGLEFMAGLGPRRSRPVRTRPGAFAEREALAILEPVTHPRPGAPSRRQRPSAASPCPRWPASRRRPGLRGRAGDIHLGGRVVRASTVGCCLRGELCGVFVKVGWFLLSAIPT